MLNILRLFSKPFSPISPDACAETVNWQTIKIQETADEMDRTDEGHIPKTIECELTSGLVDSCIPGITYTVTQEQQQQQQQQQQQLQLY